MDFLFKEYVTLNRGVTHALKVALTETSILYQDIFNKSVIRIIDSWKNDFDLKCPRTVACFIEEYELDSREFLERTMNLLADLPKMETQKDYRKNA